MLIHFKLDMYILVMAPADNILVLRPVLEPLGHIRLDAKILALSELQTRLKLQHWCLFQKYRGEEVGVGRNQRVETYCSNLKRS